VTRVKIDFVKDRRCGGKWRVGPLGNWKNKVKNLWFRPTRIRNF